MSEERRCRYIINTLRKALDGGLLPVKPSHFVRELLVETPHCDKFAPLLEEVRTAYETKLRSLDPSPNGLEGDIVNRVTTGPGSITSNDEEEVAMVVYHYRQWTYDRLLSSSSWTDLLELILTNKRRRSY